MKMNPKSSLLKRFFSNTQGNVMIMSAFIIIPLMALIGGAIDFKRAFNAKADLRACMDSAGLMVPSQGIGANSTADEVTTAVNNIISKQPRCASFTDPDTFGVHAVFTGRVITDNGPRQGHLTIKAEATMDTLILGALKSTGLWGEASTGQNFKRLTISSTTNPIEIDVAANTKVEVALVLDTTGSMGSYLGGERKINALKTAVSNLITDLTAGDPECGGDASDQECENVKVGMVPFSYTVNIGTIQNKKGIFKDTTRTTNPNWLKVPQRYSRGRYEWYRDSNGRWKRRYIPGTYQDSSYYKGCVNTRSGNNSTNNIRYLGTDSSKIPGRELSSCSSRVKPLARLTKKVSDIDDLAQELSPSGSTNTAIGLEWGWRLLSKGVNQGIDFDETGGNDEVQPYDDEEWNKVIVLMTDGTNSSWRYNGLTTTLCNNIKAEGIKIFSVAFLPANAKNGTAYNLMKNCASGNSFFHHATSAIGLRSSFQTIAKDLAQLHIAK